MADITVKVRTRRARPLIALVLAIAPLSLGHVSAQEAPTPPDPKAQSTPKADANGSSKEGWRVKGLGLKNGAFEVALAGYAQVDFRHFDWAHDPDDLRSSRELRRLRVGVKAAHENWSLEFDGDPRSSKKGDRLKDAVIGYEFSKKAIFFAGHFKPMVSPEFLTSSSRTDLVDRSMAPERLGVDREWGVMLEGEAGQFTYSAGGFKGDGSASSERSGASVAGRLTWEFRKGLTFGTSFMQGEVTPDSFVGSEEPEAKGGSGRTSSGFDFSDSPHVKGTRRRLGGDAAFARGPFRVAGEYLQMTEQRLGQGRSGEDLPLYRGRAWSLHATYLLTGEKKTSKVKPATSVFQGGKGALELAARIEGLRFDDTGSASASMVGGLRAANLAPSGATTLTAGINYWASNFLKFQGNALWESYRDAQLAPIPGKTGRYFSLVGRIQVMVP